MYASSLCSIKTFVSIVKNDVLSSQNTPSPLADPGVWPFQCSVSWPVIGHLRYWGSFIKVHNSGVHLDPWLQAWVRVLPTETDKGQGLQLIIDIRKRTAESEGSSYGEENSDQMLNVPGHLFW